MERIKKALELARRERDRAPAGTPPAGAATKRPFPQVPNRSSKYRPDELAQAHAIEVSSDILEQNRVLSGLQDDRVAQAYKLLRTQVLQRMHDKGWTSLAITGPEMGVGKSLTAINLAISIAERVNQSVLLVDLDLRRPSIQKYFNYAPECGLSEYLQGEAQLQDILIDPGMQGLLLLLGGKPLHNSSEMLSSPRMVELVEVLKSPDRSRFVLFDLPPLLATDDMLAFAPFVDAVLLVVEEGKTTREDVTRTLHLMKDTNLLGTVLNNSRDMLAAEYYY